MIIDWSSAGSKAFSILSEKLIVISKSDMSDGALYIRIELSIDSQWPNQCVSLIYDWTLSSGTVSLLLPHGRVDGPR